MLLTPRDQLVVELLAFDTPRWTDPGMALTATAIVVATLSPWLPAPVPQCILWMGAFFIPFVPIWDLRMATGSTPDGSAFLIGPYDIARAVFRVAIVRWFFATPALAALLAAWTGPANLEGLAFAVFGLICWSVLFEHWRVVLLVVSNWSVPSILRWRKLYLLFTSLVLALLSFLTLPIIAVTVMFGAAGQLPWMPSMLATVVILTPALLASRLCMFAYKRGHCDVTGRNRPAVHQVWSFAPGFRRRNRKALRRQFGPLWWLPRYMPAPPTRENAP
jgi:hypothetical protein